MFGSNIPPNSQKINYKTSLQEKKLMKGSRREQACKCTHPTPTFVGAEFAN